MEGKRMAGGRPGYDSCRNIFILVGGLNQRGQQAGSRMVQAQTVGKFMLMSCDQEFVVGTGMGLLVIMGVAMMVVVMMAMMMMPVTMVMTMTMRRGQLSMMMGVGKRIGQVDVGHRGLRGQVETDIEGLEQQQDHHYPMRRLERCGQRSAI